MKSRKLRNLDVSSVGYGCMGLSMGYGSAPAKKEAIKLIRSTFDLGCTLFNTAEFYGNGSNEKLLGEALKDIRDEAVISTKFWMAEKPEDKSTEHLMQVLRTRPVHELWRTKMGVAPDNDDGLGHWWRSRSIIRRSRANTSSALERRPGLRMVEISFPDSPS